MAVPKVVQGRKGPVKLTEDQPRKGGQAEVHRGVDAAGAIVAVKIALEGEDERRGLIAEREALTAIHGRQPGSERWLVKILDQGELPDGRPFLVLPWIEHSLQSWMRLRQPGLMQRLDALERTAEAVVQLHRSAASLAGVVLHRDLKPGNLLVEERPEGLRVVLADLGGVKERKLYDATRNTGIHTPYFAPLEQMLPIDRQADPSVDVYALAVVVYAVLVGRPPQAVMSRTGMLTHAAEQLIVLHQAGGGSSAEDRARYSSLRGAPLEDLIELGHAVALPDDDVARLRHGLSGLLSDRGEQADELAGTLAGMLAPVLRHALEPNPRLRLSRPEALLAALEAVTARLGGRPSVVLVEEVAAVASAPTPVQAGARPVSGRVVVTSSRLLPARVAAAALLTVVCSGAAGLAIWRPWSGAGTAPMATSEPAPSPPGPPQSDTLQADPSASAAPTELASRTAPEVAGHAVGARSDRSAAAPPAASEVNATAPTPAAEEAPPAHVDPPEPEPAPDPLVVVLSVEDDLGATATIDGGSLGAVLKKELGAGSHTIVLRSTIATEPRSFELMLTASGDDAWEAWIHDRGGVTSAPVIRAEGAKLKVRWRRDGSLGFEPTGSSDP